MKYLLFWVCIFNFMSCASQRKIVGNSSLRLKFPVKEIIIHTSDEFVGPCEPSISINPSNPNLIVAGSVLDNVYNSFDGGMTWNLSKLKSSHGVYGDPVIRHNTDGSVLYTHLSNSKGRAYASKEFLDRIVVQKSEDGIKWSDGTFPKVDHVKDHDKQWINIDPKSGVVLMSWTEFDKYGSKSASDKSRILFSKSIDKGQTWTDAISISQWEGDCIDDDNTTEGAYPCVGIDGAYFVVWGYNNRLYMDKSMDGGITWLKDDIEVMQQPNGWSYDIPGIDRSNGMPNMKCDYSKGKNRGNLYICWSDQKNGADDTDVWMISSNDNGKTWSNRTKVNDDKPGRQQFFAAMDVDPVTGYIYVVFYDRRNSGDEQTDVYIAYSIDGGKRFENFKINTESFDPTGASFFGDYNDISAYDGHVRPIWTVFSNSKLSVRTAIIDFENK
jgi:hypothetical protein